MSRSYALNCLAIGTALLDLALRALWNPPLVPLQCENGLGVLGFFLNEIENVIRLAVRGSGNNTSLQALRTYYLFICSALKIGECAAIPFVIYTTIVGKSMNFSGGNEEAILRKWVGLVRFAT